MSPLWLTVLLTVRSVLTQESIHYGPENAVTFDENPQAKMVKREVDPTFKGHPKTREEKWAIAFHGARADYDQGPSLINLLYMIARNHLDECTPIVLYDTTVENSEGLFLQELMRNFPFPYVHGRLSRDNLITDANILSTISKQCVSYILFMADVMESSNVLGLQAVSKVVVVARSSQWRVHEFLYHKASRSFINLLVVAQSFRDDLTLETPYILYTHELFVDGLGASKPKVLTSWIKGNLTRPEVPLFPPKMIKGYAGHRLTVVAANQPPFVFKKTYRDILGNPKVSWEGVEYRLMNLLAHRNNFSIEVREPQDLSMGSGDAVWKEVILDRADVGMGGIYVTWDRLKNMDLSISHTQDCAAFISLTSTALPKYRAIMGPFHWTVWLALTFTYLFGIFPLAFSDKHTLRHLIHNGGEVENMFWYVFGTFTNCFTFVGKNSWSRTTKITTRLLIGWYWIFTIIITACYTGSIIAFVTLPVYPATVDTVSELLAGHYRVGTLDHGGWQNWFVNSSDEDTNRLMKHLELVPTIELGLRNTTRAFFWPYAFLSSKMQLEYIVQANFTLESSKRSVLHISNKCFAPFGVALAFPKGSVYKERLNKGILKIMQSGILDKMINDVKWKMQRSSTGKLLQVSSGNSLRMAAAEERGLTLGDTQGMFLLLGAGFGMAGIALLTEWMGGCGRMCRRIKRSSSASSTTSSTATTKSRLVPTPNSKINSDAISEERSIPEVPHPPPDAEVDHQPPQDVDVVEIEQIEHDKCVDVVQETAAVQPQDVGKLFVKGHSRRSSYVDWDNEINDLFSYAKSDLDSEDERKTAASDECLDEGPKDILETSSSPSKMFGEKVSPV